MPLFMEKPSTIEKLLKNDSEIFQNYAPLLQQQNTNISQNRGKHPMHLASSGTPQQNRDEGNLQCPRKSVGEIQTFRG